MAIQGGVTVTGFIAPTSTSDTYPVIDPIYGIDGLRNLTGGTEMLLTGGTGITLGRRRAGMIVGINTGDYYKLNNQPWDGTINDWTLLNLMGTTGNYLALSGGTVTGNTIFTTSVSANTLSLKTTGNTHTITLGSGSTGYAHYNTGDQTVDYQRVRKYWGANNTYYITTESSTAFTTNIVIGSRNGQNSLTLNQTLVGGTGATVNNSLISLSPSGTTWTTTLYSGATYKPIILFNGAIGGSYGNHQYFQLSPTIATTSGASVSVVRISPYVKSSGLANFLIDAGTNTVTDGLGQHSSVFKVDTSGNTGYGNLGKPSAVTPVLLSTGGTLTADTYYYRISAVDSLGYVADSSTYTGVTIGGGSTNSINLTWTSVTGASSYRVYISQLSNDGSSGSSTSGYTKYLTASTNSIIDSGSSYTNGVVSDTNTSSLNYIVGNSNNNLILNVVGDTIINSNTKTIGNATLNGKLTVTTGVTGTSASVGTAKFTSGVVTLTNTCITSSSKVFLTVTGPSGSVGIPTRSGTTTNSMQIVSLTAGSTAVQTGDNSTFDYWIIN